MILPRSAGPLVLIGGAEDKSGDKLILRRIAELAGGRRARLAIVPTASSVPRELAEEYRLAFEDAGVTQVEVIDVRTRIESRSEIARQRLRAVTGILFTGGNQLKLTQTLGGTALLDAIKARHQAGALVAGTSAGASALSNPMIYEGAAQDALHKGKVKLTQGLGLCDGIIVDTHFVKRGRIGRLVQTVTMNPALLGLGLGEDTAVIYRADGTLECIGSGHVLVVDGQHVGYTNVTEIELGEPMAVENVTLHALVAGCGFDLVGRRFLGPRPMEEMPAAAGGERNDVGTEGATEDSAEDAT